MPATAEQAIRSSELPERTVSSYAVPFDLVQRSAKLRLDASFYNPQVAEALAALRRSNMELRPLSDLVDQIFLPPRCRRVYVEREHGVPFLQGTHVVHWKPADLKYVSRTAQPHIRKLVIRKGWILITRSGTVGRAMIVPDHWNGWAASEHVIRIIPNRKSDIPVGYLYAFLSSTYGQAQVTANIYGGVVDELTEDQVGSALVPIPRTAGQRKWMEKCAAQALSALRLKERSMLLDDQAIEDFHEYLR